MKFSSKVIGKTSKSQFKMNIYLLKYIIAKQNVYHIKELCAQERALSSIIQVYKSNNL